MIPMNSTLWHICSPDRHKTECTETLDLTETRPKTASGVLLIEFHPPLGAEPTEKQVRTEDALKWPHVVNYS